MRIFRVEVISERGDLGQSAGGFLCDGGGMEKDQATHDHEQVPESNVQ